MTSVNQPIPFPSGAATDVSPIELVLEDFREGKMVILADDERRENEGDLLVAAQCITSEHVNFMATYGRGLICLSMTEKRCQRLQLPLMVRDNTSRFSTAFTVSIEAARNVSTGISAADRATTIQAAVAENAESSDIVTPGHIFPIVAEPGGVLTRAGHTEAGTDLARLCGFEPASVLCEILNPDGTMARLGDLTVFGQKYGIRIGTIADLIRYRLETESTVKRMQEKTLETEYGPVTAIAYKDKVRGNTHLALVHGDIDPEVSTLLRVQIFAGLYEVIDAVTPGRNSWSIRKALRRIVDEGSGAVIILNYQQEFSELSDLFQQRSQDQDDGSSHDVRIIGIGSQIAVDIGFGKLKVLGHPQILHGLAGYGLEVTEYIPPQD